MYFIIATLVHVPVVQSWLGTQVSSALEHKLGTHVTVSRIDVGFLNRIIIDGVIIYDQSGKRMLSASRLAAKIELYELVSSGHISISSAQAFGLNGRFYRKNASAQPNYQFMLDSLASKDTTQQSIINLSINSLIIRHGAITFDQYDVAATPNRFNLAHLGVSNISAHFVIPYYTNDSVAVEVKKMSMRERSGFVLTNLAFRAKAGLNGAEISSFELKTPHSALYINPLKFNYTVRNKSVNTSSLRFRGIVCESKITPSDFFALLPALQKTHTPLLFSAKFHGSGNNLSLDRIRLYSQDNVLRLNAKGSLNDFKHPRWTADIMSLDCNMTTIESTIGSSSKDSTRFVNIVRNLGYVNYKGRITGHDDVIKAQGTVLTDAGKTSIIISKDGQRVSADVNTRGLNLAKISGDSRFGLADVNLKGSAILSKEDGTPSDINVDGLVSRFDYNGYPYQNILLKGTYTGGTFDGQASIDDPNGLLSLEGKVHTLGKQHRANVKATVRNLDPAALKLTDKWRGNSFSADLIANIDILNTGTLIGNISLNNFEMVSMDDSYHINKIDFTADKNSLAVNGDFGHALLSGHYNLNTIAGCLTTMLHTKLPTLFSSKSKTNNNYVLDAEITETEWLKRLFNVPLILHKPLSMTAVVNDKKHTMELLCRSEGLSYADGEYDDIEIKAHAPGDTLFATARARKLMGNGHRLSVKLDATASNDKLNTIVEWDNQRQHPMKGFLSAETVFTQSNKGRPDIHVNVRPSEVMVSDTIWKVLPATIDYSNGNLSVANFAIEHNRQHIRIDGLATRSEADSITVDLQDVDVSYILNLVNFHSVEFSGLASGKAYIKSVFFSPDAYADLRVHDFRLENGRLGELQAHVNWNKADKQIDIEAFTEDNDDGLTFVNGYVSPVKNYIDLGIKAHQTNIEFLESFCGSFLGNISARATGNVRLSGPLSTINLTGLLTASGSVHVKPLNVDYTMLNDTVHFIPDNIVFAADTIRDRNGNIGIMDGKLHHEHLTHLTYNLGIRAQHLLCYDTHDYGDDIFYGKAIGSGLCTIQGGNGRIDIDVDITPEKGSFIEYDAASPEAISNQEFITWNDATPHPLPSLADSTDADSIMHKPITPFSQLGGLASIPSDLRINFAINATPESTLRLLMDRSSGDYIALNGTGNLRATYFNKGSFDMFGTYLIDHGLYKLTIQNVIKKEFQFQQGGTIVFGGDPYNATLDLKALYTVNGVPLSDLHLGRSFSSNNVRVDCMMNIGGTPQSPRVDFDLDLPSVNSDAKQMVKTIINGEEEMNQQVVYLLSVGRFYIQDSNDAGSDNNAHSQTSLAMQSLLSGTISQQINSLLGNLVKNNNWSFGANISTGDEGFNNAEYEGLLQGRLLNNRLVINGQFGYRDNANATTSFIGDFDISYLLFPSGNLAIKVYNQTNDRYFTKSSLNTQGIGLMMKKDFNTLSDLFGIHRKRKQNK